MKKHHVITSAFLMIFFSCNRSYPDWLRNSNHSISPDGQAAVFSSQIEDKTSVCTWVHSKIFAGGAGVFDFKSSSPEGVDLSWISESTAQIVYPLNADIIRQEDSTIFEGRTIKLMYKTKD